MKFTTVASVQKKAELILGFLWLIFLLTGCITQMSSAGQPMNCSKAEEAVNEAQTQYDQALSLLAKSAKDENINRAIALKVKNLEEAEEKAFEICHQ
jgi:hypothetical protein